MARRHPEVRPTTSAEAALLARRIMHESTTSVQLLSDPPRLEAQLQAFVAEASATTQNPQIYRV